MAQFVYILASRPRGAIYLGATADLATRISQHRAGAVAARSHRYGIRRRVYFDAHALRADALRRERQLN